MRVVIGDDSVLLREGIARLLREEGIEVVEGAGDAVELMAAVEHQSPDLAIIDVRMPPTYSDEGLGAAIEIRQRWPQVALLVLSQFVEERYASELLTGETSGIGYLLKDRVGHIAEFVEVVHRVASGGAMLDQEVVRQLLAGHKSDLLGRLTPREREVLWLMAEGKSNNAIAVELVVSLGAVEKHVTNIFMKLSCLGRLSSKQRVARVAHLPGAVLIGHADCAGSIAGVGGRDEIGEEDSVADVTTASDGPQRRGAVETPEDLGVTVSAGGPFLVAPIGHSVQADQRVGLHRRRPQGASWSRIPRV